MSEITRENTSFDATIFISNYITLYIYYIWYIPFYALMTVCTTASMDSTCAKPYDPFRSKSTEISSEHVLH